MHKRLAATALIALGLLPGHSARADFPPVPPPECRVFYAATGVFSAEPTWLVNQINAPDGADASRPPDRVVAPKVLAELNRAFASAVVRAVARHAPQTHCPDTTAIYHLSPAQLAGGVALRVEVGGSTEVGGLVGGTTIRVTLGTLDREPGDAELTARAQRSVEALATPEAAVAALDRALDEAIAEAQAGLVAARAADAKAGRAVVTLIMAFYSLNSAEIAAAKALVPCIAGAAGGRVTPAAHAHEMHTETVDVRLVAGGRTGAQRVGDVAEAARAHLGNHGKYRCSLFGTPLAGRTFRVSEDAERGAVRVQFERR